MTPDPPTHRIVILGAGRSRRRDLPPALVAVDRRSRVMDWLLAAFAPLDDARVHFVSGYKASEIRSRYPDVDLIHNPDWETTGPATSLAIAPLACGRATYVTYSDVVFRPAVVQRLASVDADLVLAIDSAWRTRYDGRPRTELEQAEKVRLAGGVPAAIGRQVATAQADAEFLGLLKLSAAAARTLEEALGAGAVPAGAALPELLAPLLERGARVAAVDVEGDWAELNLPQDLARFALGTKAESLARLAPLVRRGRIGELVSFTAREWGSDRAGALERVRSVFGAAPLIVRSSALSEDQWSGSAAGAHESVADIDGADSRAVEAAVERVLASYGDPRPGDQVLVQAMLRDPVVSGVLMTRTPDLGAPYYVASFDDSSQRTDTVTAGTGERVRTVFLHRDEPPRPELPEEIRRLVLLARELEDLVGHDSLDIEFAFTRDGTAHVLQVRPIALAHAGEASDDRAVAAAIAQAKRWFGELQRPSPFVLGPRTQLSVMSDWNPAEIIGTKPKALAFSLYRHVITDSVWALQRAEYGYRDVRPCNLLVDVLGHPYVDVRATFNSFVPAALPDDAAERLVTHCLDHLREHPELHDKVEFSVSFTCLGFDFDRRAAERLRGVLSADEVRQLREALLAITRAGIERCARDHAAIDGLAGRFERIRAAGLPPLERAWVLLEDLRRHGTPLFAHLARAGFVAATLLRTLPETGCVPEGRDADYVATLATISRRMQDDARRVAAGELAPEAFEERYGHLRPGTYDITSPHYASDPDVFLRPMIEAAARARPGRHAVHPWDARAREGIARALSELGLDPDLAAFERFLAHAIEGRELSKFVFTKNLCAAIEAIAELGELHGIGREELAHVRVEQLFELRGVRPVDAAAVLRERAREGRRAFRLTEALCLPAQIFEPLDLGCFEELEATPNFVTTRSVRAPIVTLSAGSSAGTAVEGRIVVVPNADPGFDWLFSRRIAGLVTMYGGRNSHMAIRAAEFGLPAAIGVGQLLFEELARAEVIEMDCSSQVIRVVR